MDNQNDFIYAPINFASGSDTSDATNISMNTLAGIEYPAGFEGTEVSFLWSRTLHGNYVPLIDPSTGTSVTVKAASASAVAIAMPELALLQYFKLVSDNPVTADRLCHAVARPAS